MSIDSLNLIRELLECYIDEQEAKLTELESKKEKDLSLSLDIYRTKTALELGKTALEQFNGKWHR